ncbi:DUF1778 domain-containing protein [Pseudomonas sp. FYR_11]|uniref:type II toxin-antitoxin system TacA family antitoxin n=1 Tax=Pseudomonas TaxID=286 RepID=UPI00370C2C92
MTQATRLTLNLTVEQENILRQAAEAAGTSLDSFVLNSACRVATQILSNRDLVLLDNAQAQSFIALLDRPAQDNTRLKDLLSRPTPWA